MFRVVMAALACLALCVALSACGSDDDEGSDGAGQPASSDAAETPSGDELVFGAMLPVTGDYAPFTPSAIAANNIAVDEINAEGGVLGKQVKLVISDTKSTAEAAVPAFQRLTEVSKATALAIGDSDAAIAVFDGIAEQEIPTMCAYCGADQLTPGGGELFWRLSPADGQLGIAAAQFAREQGFDKAAVLGQKTDASISAVEAFKKPFTEKIGGDLCEEVMFDPGKATYQAEVQRAFSCDPQVVYATTGTEAGIPIMREWARRGYGGKWLLSQDLLTPPIAKSTPELEGNAFGPTGSMDRSTPAFESFAEKYKAETGDEPSDGLWEAASFDQWIMIALAMTKADSTEGPAIAAAVPEIANAPGEQCYSYKDCLALLEDDKEIDYYGASGSNDLNEDGDLASPRFTTTVVEGGEFVSGEAFELDPSLSE